MNKRQKEVQKAQLNAEAKTIKELKQVYKKAREDCEQRITELGNRLDVQNIQSIVYQKQYQMQMKKQLDSIIDTLETNQFNKVSDYLSQSYQNGYVGVMYDLQGQGIPLTVPINQEQVVKALEVDSKISTSLYERMGEDTKRLKNSIRAELSRGIVQGVGFTEIASHIAKGMNSPFDKAYNSAVRIARTEGHRVQNESSYHAQKVAKSKGAEVLKQWDATMDALTRPEHRELDGTLVECDEEFEIGGYTALYCGNFGVPSLDVNCRCQTLQRARWMLDADELKYLKDKAEYFGLDKTADFEEFKSKYLKLPDNADEVKVNFGGIHDITTTTTKLKTTMSDADYKDFCDLIQKNPDIAELYDTADGLNGIRYSKSRGSFSPASKSIDYGFPDDSYIRDGMHKFSTLCHEYGHYFDTLKYDGLTFNECDGLAKIVRRSSKDVASSSDQFLKAMRKDAELVKSGYNDIKSYCIDHCNTSTGVQDAVDGLGLGRIHWGHGDKYYNRFYSTWINGTYSKNGQQVKEYYKSLGFDVSNQSKVKKIARQYETASELWANISSAVACGGEEYESMKKYFPEAVNSFLEITRKLVK